jgi:hypothetical protein
MVVRFFGAGEKSKVSKDTQALAAVFVTDKGSMRTVFNKGNNKSKNKYSTLISQMAGCCWSHRIYRPRVALDPPIPSVHGQLKGFRNISRQRRKNNAHKKKNIQSTVPLPAVPSGDKDKALKIS